MFKTLAHYSEIHRSTCWFKFSSLFSRHTLPLLMGRLPLMRKQWLLVGLLCYCLLFLIGVWWLWFLLLRHGIRKFWLGRDILPDKLLFELKCRLNQRPNITGSDTTPLQSTPTLRALVILNHTIIKRQLRDPNTLRWCNLTIDTSGKNPIVCYLVIPWLVEKVELSRLKLGDCDKVIAILK